MEFKAFLVQEEDNKYTAKVTTLTTDQLPEGDVLVKVNYSSLNYKDALSYSGNKGVTRQFPHVPGIDAVGVVETSASEKFKKGEQVLITGFDLGMNTWGGYGEYIRVPEKWVLPLPNGMSAYEAMCYGTAGLTAGLSIMKVVEAGVKPEDGPVVVSGATGGVGSLSVAILAHLGYEVVAISGKDAHNLLVDQLGAKEVVSRTDFEEQYNSRPMAKTVFAAGIDTVAGGILSGMIKSVKYNGIVTCCGMVGGINLETSIFPFILRGATLAGVDSVECSVEQRQKVWNHLATDWKPKTLQQLVEQISIDQLEEKLNVLLQGEAKGRYLLAHH